MKFDGSLAVVTGGGDGMGRELVIQLAKDGCSVALCDLNLDAAEAEETRRLAEQQAKPGVKVSTFRCNVAIEVQLQDFARHVASSHFLGNRKLLLFNNAGTVGAGWESGGGSMVTESREAWERCFNVCWYGVYYSCRAFMPLLLAAPEAYVVNTSSGNGFWANGGFLTPHTAYSAAKFAVKGFTEALINDLRLNAPHVKVAVVMPGAINTGISGNSRKENLGISGALSNANARGVREIQAKKAMRVAEMKAAGDKQAELLRGRNLLAGYERNFDNMSDEQLTAQLEKDDAHQRTRRGGTTQEAAATIILDGVRNDEWRILVGKDVEALDEAVRKDPQSAYDSTFDFDAMVSAGILKARI